MTTGYVAEIFSSLQGEGPFVGERQLFIRLAGCPWRCDYCDTPKGLTAEGAKQYSVEELLDEVHRALEKKDQRVVSLTGGEPLSQANFLAELMPALRRFGLKNYLETSGTQPEHLRRVVDHCDVVAMDIKLPSAIGREFWTEHREFLSVAGKKAFVKIVVTQETADEEVRRALDMVSSVDPGLCVVLQPVTPIADLEHRLAAAAGGRPVLSGWAGKSGAPRLVPPAPDRLARWWTAAEEKLSDVRVVPQMHPVWGMP